MIIFRSTPVPPENNKPLSIFSNDKGFRCFIVVPPGIEPEFTV